MRDPPLSLERFATLQAAMDAGAARDELLAQEGLSLEAWHAAQRGWFERLADEERHERMDLARRYAELYREAQASWPLGSTLPLAGEPPHAPALPFEAGEAAPPPSAAEAMAREAASLSGGTAAMEDDDLHTTPALDSAAGATALLSEGGGTEVLPADRGSADVVDGWPVERWASLCVELERHPARRAAVLGRYGIDVAGHHRLQESWGKRLAASVRLARRFLRARSSYIEWLERAAR